MQQIVMAAVKFSLNNNKQKPLNAEVHSTRKKNRLVLSCQISNVDMLMPDVT